ncbi:hypothetical protein [Rhodoblastus sp.]|jgi:hypothetical protein|uniref:hypothetical protein n=1 Tax=Rhodoblastus sp. TaxID=1962975 RepID=UPI002621652C|nr:hypothetical protein [Rhodoblastus sp.]
MKAEFAPRRRSARKIFAGALTAFALAGAAEARAQQNPLHSLTNTLGWTTDAGDGPDFVQQSRPDGKTMGYSALAGAEKKRVPVKKPEELKADQDKLVADRAQADAKRKQLQGASVDAVAPSKAAPIKDE